MTKTNTTKMTTQEKRIGGGVRLAECVVEQRTITLTGKGRICINERSKDVFYILTTRCRREQLWLMKEEYEASSRLVGKEWMRRRVPVLDGTSLLGRVRVIGGAG